MIAMLSMAILAGCSEDKLKVIHNNDRVSDLERRMALNEQLDAMQDQRLSALEEALAAEEQARINGDLSLSDSLAQEIADRAAADAELASLLEAEERARIAGDKELYSLLQIEIANRINGDKSNSAALSLAVLLQSITNFVVQGQISEINGKISKISGEISTLQEKVKNLDNRIEVLEGEVAQLALDMVDLELSMKAQIDKLAAQQAATQAQLDAEGVKVYKCNAPNSTERIFKINGKFYAAMNRVTKQTIQVITGSSSQTFTTPDMCLTSSGTLVLPNSGGRCTPNSGPFKSTKVPGETIVVPSYTTTDVSVVTSVKIALDILTDGEYVTTDGGPACSFSISGGGTNQTGLVPVQ